MQVSVDLPQAINSLMSAEFAFYDELVVGMETYVHPLRTIVSQESHRTMFLHLNEVCLSLSHVKAVTDSCQICHISNYSSEISPANLCS